MVVLYYVWLRCIGEYNKNFGIFELGFSIIKFIEDNFGLIIIIWLYWFNDWVVGGLYWRVI